MVHGPRCERTTDLEPCLSHRRFGVASLDDLTEGDPQSGWSFPSPLLPLTSLLPPPSGRALLARLVLVLTGYVLARVQSFQGRCAV